MLRWPILRPDVLDFLLVQLNLQDPTSVDWLTAAVCFNASARGRAGRFGVFACSLWVGLLVIMVVRCPEMYFPTAV